MDHQPQESKNTPAPDNIPFWRVVMSVVQASFGVQNQANRERDFKQGKLMPFLVAAVLFTVVFVMTLLLVVNLVLAK